MAFLTFAAASKVFKILPNGMYEHTYTGVQYQEVDIAGLDQAQIEARSKLGHGMEGLRIGDDEASIAKLLIPVY